LQTRGFRARRLASLVENRVNSLVMSYILPTFYSLGIMTNGQSS